MADARQTGSAYAREHPPANMATIRVPPMTVFNRACSGRSSATRPHGTAFNDLQNLLAMTEHSETRPACSAARNAMSREKMSAHVYMTMPRSHRAGHDRELCLGRGGCDLERRYSKNVSE
jgi:hypothetical protein